MKALDKIEFSSNINYDDGSVNRSLGHYKSTMELFAYEDEPKCFLIEWDIPQLEETHHIGIWLDRNNELQDYDGVFELPKQAIEILRKNNIIVSESFY